MSLLTIIAMGLATRSAESPQLTFMEAIMETEELHKELSELRTALEKAQTLGIATFGVDAIEARFKERGMDITPEFVKRFRQFVVEQTEAMSDATHVPR